MLARFLGAVRRKGIRQTFTGGILFLYHQYRNFEIVRFYRKAARSNRRFDVTYGVETGARVDLDSLGVDSPSLGSAIPYEPVPEVLFRQAAAKLRIDYPSFTFIDYGCGKGKAMLLASMYPFAKILGVEFSAPLCQICRANIGVFAPGPENACRFQVVCADVVAFSAPPVPSVFFMYNPFRDTVMKEAVTNIARSLSLHPRPVWIVYCNPDYASFIADTGAFHLVARGRRYRVYRSGVR